jgi:hypothetical protein
VTIAKRCMKARRAGLCPVCGGWIYRGRQIALVGETWMCVACCLKGLPDEQAYRDDLTAIEYAHPPSGAA